MHVRMYLESMKKQNVKKMGLQRLAGWIGLGLGSLHVVYSPMGWDGLWSRVAADGVWDTVTIEPTTPEGHLRAEAFWTSLGSFGVPVVTLGGVVLAEVRQGRSVPRWVGWTVLGWGVPVAVMLPRSPSWAVPAMGLLLVLGAHEQGEGTRPQKVAHQRA